MRNSLVLTRVLAVATTLVLLAGCSHSPTAPVIAPGREASGALLWSEPVPDGQTQPEPEPAPAPASTLVQSSRTLDPLLGGVVSAGRFKVVVPPGALRQRATISVTQRDPMGREVELGIAPESANGFLVPVTLTANCADMPATLLRVQTIWWWNPGAQRWDAVLNVQINLFGRSVSAPLWHFSKYKVDSKAGW